METILLLVTIIIFTLITGFIRNYKLRGLKLFNLAIKEYKKKHPDINVVITDDSSACEDFLIYKEGGKMTHEFFSSETKLQKRREHLKLNGIGAGVDSFNPSSCL